MKKKQLDDLAKATVQIQKLSQTKAQIMVIKREFETLLAKAAIERISQESSKLLGSFEMGASENQIQVFVHPQQ